MLILDPILDLVLLAALQDQTEATTEGARTIQEVQVAVVLLEPVEHQEVEARQEVVVHQEAEVQLVVADHLVVEALQEVAVLLKAVDPLRAVVLAAAHQEEEEGNR